MHDNNDNDTDTTEELRRVLTAAINACPQTRQTLAEMGTTVYDTQELGAEFVVLGFMAPFVHVERKRDGRRGTLLFQHHPRLYFGFMEDA